MRLTDSLIANEKYKGQPFTDDGGRTQWPVCVLWDDELQGFGVRIYPPVRGRPSRKDFIVTWRSGLKSRTMALGTYGTDFTLRQARRAAKQALDLARRGRDPIEERQLALGIGTNEDLASRFLHEHVAAKKKPATGPERAPDAAPGGSGEPAEAPAASGGSAEPADALTAGAPFATPEEVPTPAGVGSAAPATPAPATPVEREGVELPPPAPARDLVSPFTPEDEVLPAAVTGAPVASSPERAAPPPAVPPPVQQATETTAWPDALAPPPPPTAAPSTSEPPARPAPSDDRIESFQTRPASPAPPTAAPRGPTKMRVLSLPDRLHRDIERRARAAGMTMSAYLQSLLDREPADPPAES